MNIEEAVSFLEMSEKKYSVHDWIINGINIWPLVRLNIKNDAVASAIIAKPIGNRYFHKLKYAINIVKNQLHIAMRDGQHNQPIRNADVLILGYSVSRNVIMPNGTLLDHNLDPIKIYLEKRGLTTFFIETYGNSGPKLPRYSNSLFIDKILLKTRFCQKIMWTKQKTVKCQLDGFDDFLCELKAVGGGSFSKNDIANKVVNLEELADCYLKLLNMIKPKVLILTDWQTNMALSLAAHRLHIPVIEIQHGVAASGGKRNITYSNWLGIPKGGYELAPDYMWVWGEDDFDCMASWAKESWKPFIGGHPMNLFWSDPENDFVHYYQERYNKYYYNNKPVILFTLQWGKEYPGWVIDYINNHDEYTWLIRRHPIVDEGIEKFILKLRSKTNIIIDRVDEFPLEILLMNVDLHLTMYSSVVLDAELYSCPSIVLHDAAKKYFKKQISRGVVHYVGEDIALNEMIKMILFERKDKKNDNKIINKHHFSVGCNGINNIVDIVEKSKPKWRDI